MLGISAFQISKNLVAASDTKLFTGQSQKEKHVLKEEHTRKSNFDSQWKLTWIMSSPEKYDYLPLK